VQIKLEFLTDCDAQHGAYYLQDRGYSVKLMGKALAVGDLEPSVQANHDLELSATYESMRLSN